MLISPSPGLHNFTIFSPFFCIIKVYKVAGINSTVASNCVCPSTDTLYLSHKCHINRFGIKCFSVRRNKRNDYSLSHFQDGKILPSD